MHPILHQGLVCKLRKANIIVVSFSVKRQERWKKIPNQSIETWAIALQTSVINI